MKTSDLRDIFCCCEAPSGHPHVSSRWCPGTGHGIDDAMVCLSRFESIGISNSSRHFFLLLNATRVTCFQWSGFCPPVLKVNDVQRRVVAWGCVYPSLFRRLETYFFPDQECSFTVHFVANPATNFKKKREGHSAETKKTRKDNSVE